MDMQTAIISGMGAMIMICLGIIGSFMKLSLKEGRDNTLEIGVLKGTIESNRAKSHDDVQALSRETNIQIQHLTTTTEMLAKSISKLMDLMMDNQYGKDK